MQTLLFTFFLALLEPAVGATADRFGLSVAYFALAGILSFVYVLLMYRSQRWLSVEHN